MDEPVRPGNSDNLDINIHSKELIKYVVNTTTPITIGIHGQWLWINPKKELVIVKLASHHSEVDTDTDRLMLAAFGAIADTLT